MKLLFTFLLLGLSHVTFSQIAKGRPYIGGSAQFSLNENNQTPTNIGIALDFKSRSTQLTPFAGYMVSDKVGIGAELFFSSSLSEYETSGTTTQEDKSLGIGGGVFAEFFIPLSDKFYFSLRNLARYRSTRTTNTTFSGTTSPFEFSASRTTTNLSLDVLPRLTFFPNRNWACSMGIGNISASVFKPNVDADAYNTTLTATLGSLSLGIAYFFK